jgi:hypothetical protein
LQKKLVSWPDANTNSGGLNFVLVLFIIARGGDGDGQGSGSVAAGYCKDIRLQCWEMQALIDADLDCSNVASLLMRMQADLMFFLETRERLYALETA